MEIKRQANLLKKAVEKLYRKQIERNISDISSLETKSLWQIFYPPIIMKNRKDVWVGGGMLGGGDGGVAGDEGVVALHHGQQVHKLRSVLWQILQPQQSLQAHNNFF